MRLEGKIKMGYYPTPLSVVDRIRSFLSLKNIPAIVLDEIPYSDIPLYSLPSSKSIHLFRSSVIDERELEREMADSIIWQRLN